jgi:tetratricopeptide (TPR) repeat protein
MDRVDRPKVHIEKPLRLVLFALGLTLITACNQAAEKSPAEFISAAQAALDAREVSEARIHALNAVSLEKNNPVARLMLGQVLLRMNDAAAAEIEFKKAINLGLGGDQVYVLLAEALLAQQKQAELLRLDLPPQSAPASRVAVLAARAESLMDSGRIEEVRQTIAEIERIDPTSRIAMPAMARYLMGIARPEEAERLMINLVREQPDNYSAWLRLGLARADQGNHPGALVAFEKAVELAYVPGIERQYRVSSLLHTGELEAARKEFAGLSRLYPEAPLVSFVAGYFAYHDGNYLDAQSHFDETLSRLDSHGASSLLAAAAYAQTGSFEVAKHHLTRVRAAATPSAGEYVEIVAAFVDLREGNPESANRRLETVGSVGALDSYVTTLKLLIAGALNPEPAGLGPRPVAATTAMIDAPPARVALLFEAAEQGQDSTATDLAVAAGRAADTYRQIREVVSQQDFAEAKRIADEYAASHPDDPAAYVLQAVVAVAQRNIDEAGALYTKALDLDPAFTPALRSLATVKMLQREFGEAAALQARVIEQEPRDYRAHMGAAAAEVARQGYAEAQRWLEGAAQIRPNAYEPVELLARLLAKEGDNARALEVLKRHDEAFRDNTSYLALRANLALEAGERDAALADYGRLATLLHGDALIALKHAEVLQQAGDQAGFERELQRALTIEPRLPGPRRKLVSAYLARNDVEAARQALGDPADYQDAPRLLALSAKVAIRENRLDDALSDARRAFDLAANNENLFVLATVEWLRGEKSQSLSRLSAWLVLYPDDLLTMNLLADRLLEEGRAEEAKTWYEKSFVLNPKQPAVLNNLAWILRDSDTERAYELAKEALALAPGSQDIQATLATVEQLRGSTR